MRTSGSFSALYYRDFRLFWAGQWISFTGTWMHMTAQGWLVYELTHSPLFLGLVSTATQLPILLFSLMGGVVADRIEKRRLLILTQALSIAPVLIIGLLTSAGIINVWHVMALVFMMGLINAFDIPARQAFLVHMVERGNLLNAIALNSAAFNGARMIGPVFAGLIIALLGVASCFYINAASYLAVVLALSFIKAESPILNTKNTMLSDIKEGMSFVRTDPDVLSAIMLLCVFSLFGLPFVSQLPVFAEEVFAAGPKGLGYLIGASGAGAFGMAVFLAFKGDIHNKNRAIALTSVVMPSVLIAFSLTRNFNTSLALMLTAGLCVVVFLSSINSFVQLNAPDGLRGRVMSLYTFVFLGMTPIGHTLLGVLANYIGSARAVLISECTCLALSAIILFMRKK